MNDYLDPQNAIDMPDKADSAFAIEFLITVKTGIRNYGFAITETTDPELRTVFQRQMDKALDLHAELTDFLIDKEWLNPHDIGAQYEIDIKSVEEAVSIANLNIFPRDTDRLGTFATPNE